MKTIALFTLLLFSYVPSVAQHRTRTLDKSFPVSVLGILAIEDSTRSLNFFLLGQVHQSCLEYSGYSLRILKEDADYLIQPIASRVPGKKCDAGERVVAAIVPFPLLSRAA